MIVILGFLVSGIVFGYVLKIKKNLKKNLDRLYVIIVACLLFLLGISIGSNKEIFYKIHRIGFQALIFALLSIAGSVIFVKLISNKIIKEEKT